MIGAVVLGAPSQANAAFTLSVQQDGGAITQVATGADFSALSYTNTFGDFRITLLGVSSDNGAALSDLLGAVTSIQNTSGATHTLRILASQTNYTLPGGSPLNVESGLGGSLIVGTTLGLNGVFQAYADKNNNLLGLGDYTNGPQSAAQAGTTFDTGSASGLFARIAGSPYSLSSVVTLTIGGGGTVNYSNHVNVTPTATTPAPAGVVLALTGLPCLGFGTWLRRRKVLTA